jgi:RNA polymerase sigma-70 factor (ECF subfamily)
LTATRASAKFDRTFLPHLDAAYNLARVLMRNAEDAEDVVQEAYLRALRALRALRGFSRFRGEASLPWLLSIVRNTSFTWLRKNRSRVHAEYQEDLCLSRDADPEVQSMRCERTGAVERCVEQLPADFREAFVLREMEDLSYREIAAITDVPAGTVMSRLARARARLAECLTRSASKDLSGGRIGS